MYYKCLYSSVIPELDMESMFIPLDSSLRWNDINILDASRYIRDTTLAVSSFQFFSPFEKGGGSCFFFSVALYFVDDHISIKVLIIIVNSRG